MDNREQRSREGSKREFGSKKKVQMSVGMDLEGANWSKVAGRKRRKVLKRTEGEGESKGKWVCLELDKLGYSSPYRRETAKDHMHDIIPHRNGWADWKGGGGLIPCPCHSFGRTRLCSPSQMNE